MRGNSQDDAGPPGGRPSWQLWQGTGSWEGSFQTCFLIYKIRVVWFLLLGEGEGGL